MNAENKDIFSLERYYALAHETGAQVFTIGHSHEQRPILALKKGNAAPRVLLIARLHGNEPAPTQAVLDFFKAYSGENLEVYGIFLANPDGAARYEQNWLKHPEPSWKNNFEKARLNANDVDLNRDWLELTQRETQAIHKFIRTIHPEFVMDLHEYYWKDGYPPEIPTADEDGFMATMTDCPFFGVHEQVALICRELMEEISPPLENEFNWKIKLRHFIGEKRNTYSTPSYLGIYLALSGIPKLLVETWGVGCSTLLLKERIAFHTRAIRLSIDGVSKRLSFFQKMKQMNSMIERNFLVTEEAKAKRFTALLKKQGIHFTVDGTSIRVKVLKLQMGFVEAIFNEINN